MTKDNLFIDALNVLAGVIVAFFTFFIPMLGLLGLITGFALVDHFFGVWRVLKLKERFEFWKGTKRTFSKVVAYSVILGLIFALDQKLLNEFSFRVVSVNDVLTKILALALCWHEWRSINRNFKEVKGVSLWDRFIEMIQGGRKMLEEGGKLKKMLFLAGVILVLSGCSVFSPVNRHDRLVRKYPYLHLNDSVERLIEVPVRIPGVKGDTIFKDTGRIDTVRLYKDRLKVQYYRDGDTVYLSGECDPVEITKKVKVMQPVKYYPVPLKWWQFPVVVMSISFASLAVGYFISRKGIKK